MIRNVRGNVLLVAILTATVSAIVSYSVLYIATTQGRQGRFQRERTRVRNAAEAGVVYAQQQLWQNASYAGGTITINGIQVAVTVTNPGAGNAHEIQAEVLGY